MRFLNRYWTILLALVIAILAGRYLFTTRHFYVHDDMQVFRVNEYVSCLKDGQFPCRWSANLGKGYGYPLFVFYPPLIYIIPSLLYFLGLPIIFSLNLLMFGSFLIASLGIYILIRILTQSQSIALLGSALYTLYPFHAVNVYLRGVYAENLAWSLLPWLFLASYRQFQSGRFSRSLPFLLAFVYLTHLLSAFLVTFLLFAWIIILSLIQHKNLLLQLASFLLHTLIAVALSAFFLIPALIEKSLVQTDSLISGYYHYTNHFVSFEQLFLRPTWHYGASLWGSPPDEMPFMVGYLHTGLSLLVIFFALFLVLRKRLPWQQLIFPSCLLLTGYCLLFLSHSKSLFIWQLIPVLSYFQFPWRFIAWAALPIILGVTLLLSRLPARLSFFLTLSLTLFALAYYLPYFRPKSFDNLTDADFLSGSEYKAQQVKSLYDYLPRTVHTIPVDHAGFAPTVIRNSSHFEETVVLDTPHLHPFPIFAYPGWIATVNDTSSEIIPEEDSGLISLALPAGESRVVLDFVSTPLRTFSNWLSLLTLLTYLLCIGYNTKCD